MIEIKVIYVNTKNNCHSDHLDWEFATELTRCPKT